ncbi:hypothetical protein ACJJTC_018764 [Scirpophaga incertulas]
MYSLFRSCSKLQQRRRPAADIPGVHGCVMVARGCAVTSTLAPGLNSSSKPPTLATPLAGASCPHRFGTGALTSQSELDCIDSLSFTICLWGGCTLQQELSAALPEPFSCVETDTPLVYEDQLYICKTFETFHNRDVGSREAAANQRSLPIRHALREGVYSTPRMRV